MSILTISFYTYFNPSKDQVIMTHLLGRLSCSNYAPFFGNSYPFFQCIDKWKTPQFDNVIISIELITTVSLSASEEIDEAYASWPVPQISLQKVEKTNSLSSTLSMS